jgi:hypothetical protein
VRRADARKGQKSRAPRRQSHACCRLSNSGYSLNNP